ncbi:MAG TPA: hypothetical protein VN680_19140 [Burkholderiaceae bacterium]|jgi:hypothetical protein|nr:hypothetical protein [Burkholderiaceae bacterium]
MSDDFFAPPAFKAEEALVGLKRSLRELKLAERGTGFELGGQPVIEIALDGDAIRARIVARPARTPQWDTLRLASSAEVRKFLDEARRRAARWSERDE